jgi:hypothetical protein
VLCQISFTDSGGLSVEIRHLAVSLHTLILAWLADTPNCGADSYLPGGPQFPGIAPENLRNLLI